MKGIIFTEFLDFVAANHGADMVDDIVEDAATPHGGAYTSVGTYPFQEMQLLLTSLCRRTSANAAELLHAFGDHLCSRFVVKYPEFFAASANLFDFIESIDRHIHVEVHKLYPDAELPRFETKARAADQLIIDYISCRPLASLAQGMIHAAARHYSQTVTVSHSQIAGDPAPFTRFVINHAA